MARKIEVEITGDSSSLERALSRAGKSSQSNFTKISKAARVAGLALGGVLAGAAIVGFKELAEGQKVAAQTAAVLKSTGGAANVTAKDVDTLSMSLSKMSGVDDEAIASSENLLLTFRNVRNEVGKGNAIFDQATKVILDTSVAMGTDLQSATLQVGKALQDPIRGLTALRRIGVSFTEAQEKQIAALVESGDTMKAQKIILAELNKEFGGSAKAAGETLPGQLNKLKNSFDETAGTLVEALLPALESVLGKLTVFAEWAQKNPKQMKMIVIGLGALAAALVTASVAQTALNLAVLANPYVAAAAAIVVLAGALVVLWKKSEFVRKHWQLLLGSLGVTVVVMVTVAKAVVRHMGTITAAFQKVRSVAQVVFTAVANSVRTMLAPILTVINAVRELIGWINRIPSIGSATGGPGIGSANPRGQGVGGSALGGIVQRTGLQRVHTGEQIVPARVSRGGHGSSGGPPGGPVVIMTTQAIASWLQDQNRRYAMSNGGRGILG